MLLTREFDAGNEDPLVGRAFQPDRLSRRGQRRIVGRCSVGVIGEMSAMKLRWGLGPVFAFESLIAARRWQVYALRAVYVGLLLAGLALSWGPSDGTLNSPADAAAIGRMFLLTVIAVQFAVVRLAAPAATAGAVCVDKARGTLLHAFVTQLTDREIVLGKLGARLIPVLALMACGLPVLALGSFLGG